MWARRSVHVTNRNIKRDRCAQMTKRSVHEREKCANEHRCTHMRNRSAQMNKGVHMRNKSVHMRNRSAQMNRSVHMSNTANRHGLNVYQMQSSKFCILHRPPVRLRSSGKFLPIPLQDLRPIHLEPSLISSFRLHPRLPRGPYV
jgi:hypothetical protein